MVHDARFDSVIRMPHLGLREQVKVEETHLPTVPEEIESIPKKKEKVSLGLERLKRSPYLSKLQTSPRNTRLITFKKDLVGQRLRRVYKYLQEFRTSSRYDIGSMQDCCQVDTQEGDSSQRPGIDEI